MNVCIFSKQIVLFIVYISLSIQLCFSLGPPVSFWFVSLARSHPKEMVETISIYSETFSYDASSI